MKAVHVFYSTMPSAKGGDIRSRDVAESLVEVGVNVVAISSPFQPPMAPGSSVEVIGPVTYVRTFSKDHDLRISEDNQGVIVRLRKLLRIFSFMKSVRNLCKTERPDVVHAHSTFFCAAAAYFSSRTLGIPFMYEVRSLWEERAVMKSPTPLNVLISRTVRGLETLAMKSADHVVVISEGLRQEVSRRGVPCDKISVVGNAANLTKIPKVEPTCVEKKNDDLVFGYIGSLSEIEGLDLLIDAVRSLRLKGWRNRVLIYGSGPAELDLIKRADGIDGVIFCGAFSPNDANSVYSTVDVIVNPRRRSALTDKVTPLKPLEAMAFKKLVLVSSVNGMLELVRDDENGYVFEADDVEGLKSALLRISENDDDFVRIVSDAYEYVRTRRSWRSNALVYEGIYKKMCA